MIKQGIVLSAFYSNSGFRIQGHSNLWQRMEQKNVSKSSKVGGFSSSYLLGG